MKTGVKCILISCRDDESEESFKTIPIRTQSSDLMYRRLKRLLKTDRMVWNVPDMLLDDLQDGLYEYAGRWSAWLLELALCLSVPDETITVGWIKDALGKGVDNQAKWTLDSSERVLIARTLLEANIALRRRVRRAQRLIAARYILSLEETVRVMRVKIDELLGNMPKER